MIRVELRKQAFRMRTYIALGLMIGVPILITLAVEFGRRPHDREQSSYFDLATRSGINVPLAALGATTTFLLVIVVALFAGGAIAEESNWGSLRYLLLRPISRNRLLASKLVVACIMALIATVLIPITGLVAGPIAFGRTCRARIRRVEAPRARAPSTYVCAVTTSVELRTTRARIGT